MTVSASCPNATSTPLAEVKVGYWWKDPTPFVSYPVGILDRMAEVGEELLIYGETIEALRPALAVIADSMVRRADGGMEIEFALDPEAGAPFMRALKRAEAELLLEQAGGLGGSASMPRTPDERCSDAFLRVIGAGDLVDGARRKSNPLDNSR
jgi:hypothetical protein